jgi:hypothetical protein
MKMCKWWLAAAGCVFVRAGGDVEDPLATAVSSDDVVGVKVALAAGADINKVG